MYIYRLAHALGEAGHHVDVIHDVDSYYLQHPGEPEIQFNEHSNVIRHELRSPYGWLSPLLTQQTGRPYLKRKQINHVLNSRPYDVIQYHNISLLGPEILSINPPQGKPVKLYMTHEHWLICPTHVLWKYNRRACEKPNCLPCTLLANRPPQLWRYTSMLQRASQHVDQFVSPSRFTARMHAERGFPKPVAHLPYFIDRSDKDWQYPGPRPQESPYFLFVGRLEIIKGLHTLIDLWELVPDADLLVVGTGTQAEILHKKAQGNSRIKFLGALPQRELGNLYFHAQATIVPSITYETFGIIILESFARKTPVIVRDLGALPEVVNDSQGGFIYNSDDEVITYIHDILSNPSIRKEMGERGYNSFIRLWSKEAHLQIYFDLIRSLETQNRTSQHI
jgi:glycosyltransferase involved in cell wall biosynthesis